MARKRCKECGKDVSTSEEVCPLCGKKNPTGRMSMTVKVFLVIFVLFMIGVIMGGPEEPQKPDVSLISSPAGTVIPASKAIRHIQLGFQWSKNSQDKVMMADFTIMNPLDYAIKDIEVTCTYFSKSGDKINSNKKTINDVIPPKEIKVFKDFNMGAIHDKTHSTACNCTNIKVVQ